MHLYIEIPGIPVDRSADVEDCLERILDSVQELARSGLLPADSTHTIGIGMLRATVQMLRDEILSADVTKLIKGPRNQATDKKLRRALVKYLKSHPHVLLRHPGGVPAIDLPTSFKRKFLKIDGEDLVFAGADVKGEVQECTIRAEPANILYYGDRFEVMVPVSRGKIAIMPYFYLEG